MSTSSIVSIGDLLCSIHGYLVELQYESLDEKSNFAVPVLSFWLAEVQPGMHACFHDLPLRNVQISFTHILVVKDGSRLLKSVYKVKH
jgi:hypothetical protein